jgi:hypothetical protein
MMIRRKLSPLATSIVVGLVALIVGYGFGAALAPSPQNYFWAARTPIVDKALDLYGQGKVSRSDLLRKYQPVVVDLPNMTCVAMKFRTPAAGGEDTMCFDKEERRLLFFYTSGD